MKKIISMLCISFIILTACSSANTTSNIPQRVNPPGMDESSNSSTDITINESNDFVSSDESILQESNVSKLEPEESIEESQPEISQESSDEDKNEDDPSIPEQPAQQYNYEQLYNKGDDKLRALVNANKVFKNEVTWTQDKYCETATKALQTWVAAIGFEGCQINNNNIDVLYFPPKNSYFDQSITLGYAGERLIDYRVMFYDFEAINVDSVILKLKGLYGIDVNKADLQQAINDHKESIYELEPETAFAREIYNQNNIYVHVAKGYSKGVYFISITSGLKNPNYIPR